MTAWGLRAMAARDMLWGRKSGLGRRSFDNCWENGDGDKIHARLVRYAMEEPDFARHLLHGRNYRVGYLEKGEYDCGEMVWRYCPPGILAAAAVATGAPIDTLTHIDASTRARMVEFMPAGLSSPAASPPVQVANPTTIDLLALRAAAPLRGRKGGHSEGLCGLPMFEPQLAL